MNCAKNGRRTAGRSGSILIIVLVAIVILSLSAYTFTALMQTEEEAARLMSRRVQSKYLVDSGVDYVRLFLSYDDATIVEKGGRWDSPQQFQAVPVAVDTTNPELLGRFSVVTSSLDDEGNPEGFRFGLMDESNKLNLNILPLADNWIQGGGRTLLMALPEMTEEIADAIIDWIDADDEARDFGIESSYYSGMQPPYACKNGPMDSLEELLLVRGVTPQLLFGLDTNRNGILDRAELLGQDVASTEADMQLGWANYLTLYSKESNLNADGLQRININNPDLEQLYDDLRSSFNEEWSRFIILYRINGPYTLKEEDEPTPISVPIVIDFEQPAKYTFTQILDLVDAHTTAKNPDDESKPFILPSPINMLNAGFTVTAAMQNLTSYEGTTIPGRVNFMQAPRRVLEGIPGLTPEIVETIVSRREFELDDPEGADANRKYETWLLVEGIVDLATMRIIFPFVCTGGDVYRAEVVGYYDDGVGTSRAEVVFDTTVPIPRLLFWRDKSELQQGYTLDTLGIDLVE